MTTRDWSSESARSATDVHTSLTCQVAGEGKDQSIGPAPARQQGSDGGGGLGGGGYCGHTHTHAHTHARNTTVIAQSVRWNVRIARRNV